MSSTNPKTRGGNGADVFPTDPRITADFLRRAGHRLPAGRWVEPAVGDGAIVRAVEAWRPGGQKWLTCDIRPEAAGIALGTQLGGGGCRADWTDDWTHLCAPITRFDHAEVYITNPPFAMAEEFVRRCFARGGPRAIVSMLLRINFLGSFDRMPFWQQHPQADLYPIVPRPSFSPDGKTDSCEYAWFVWAPDSTGKIHHPDAPWRAQTRGAAA